MQEGYLQWNANSTLSWVSSLKPMGLGLWNKDTVMIPTGDAIGVNSIPAHICTGCKLVIGDYNEAM